jgi:hypothetical protein
MLLWLLETIAFLALLYIRVMSFPIRWLLGHKF